MTYPHETHTPTLPGDTITGEKYIGFDFHTGPPRGRRRRPARYVVNRIRGNSQRHFRATRDPEGAWERALAYRDAVLAGTPVAPARWHRPDYNDPGSRGGPRRASVAGAKHLEFVTRLKAAGVFGQYDEAKTSGKRRDILGTAAEMHHDRLRFGGPLGRIFVPKEIDKDLRAYLLETFGVHVIVFKEAE